MAVDLSQSISYGLAVLGDFAAILDLPMVADIFFAVVSIVVGMVLGKFSQKFILFVGRHANVKNKKAVSSFATLFGWFIFVLAIIIALSFLGVDAAAIIVQNIISLLPPLISLALLLFLGVLIINLVMDVLLSILYRVGLTEYLAVVGVSKDLINNTFTGLKLFLYLILLSSSLNYVGLNIPSIDVIVTALIYVFIVLAGALAFFVFKDPLRNLFAGIYIEKNLFKIGQRVKVGEFMGEVMAITNHGVLLKLPTGFNVFVPNQEVLSEHVFLKRAKTEMSKLESIRSNFVCQLPSYCGPASGSMLLSFFGFDVTQEQLGSLAGTKVPGGTSPKNLIAAARKITGNAVNGVLVKYDQIYNLKEEVKSWLSEGALVLLWFKKPVVFPEKKSKSGHFVLCVGIEGDELIVMDSSVQTAGVYLVDYRLLEEAMSSEFDRKSRGYLVFAKKGTSAYWRISQGLIYGEITAYKELSKSFERYLKRLLRKTATMHDFLAEPVSKLVKQEPIKHIWEPKMETREISEKIKKEVQKEKKKEAEEKEAKEAEKGKKKKGKKS